MSDLSDRIRNLTPEQRELLHRRVVERQTSELEKPLPMQSASTETAYPDKEIAFSLFFFSADGTTSKGNRYEFLTECARFADRNGFSAVWTPERHFQAFGGLYPNPGVLGAALAMVTQHVQIRAGSLVLPLHNPVRVAEDWAVVDNLSHGRVAISFATGWHEHDYVIAPQAYQDRRERTFRNILLVRRLWAGEEVELSGVNGKPVRVKTLPRPIQPELPFWITVTSPQTWFRAGEIGANVLTAFAGVSLEDLRQSIAKYRQARLENGYDPRTGIVSLMLHTYLDHDLEDVRRRVRKPLKDYLQSFIDQYRPLNGEMADSSSPELQEMLEFAFERYFADHALLGTPDKCAAIIAQLAAAGVNDLACLVDFGLDLNLTLASLQLLAELRRSLSFGLTAPGQKEGIARP